MACQGETARKQQARALKSLLQLIHSKGARQSVAMHSCLTDWLIDDHAALLMYCSIQPALLSAVANELPFDI